MDEQEAKRRLTLSGDIPGRTSEVQPHTTLIPPISLELPVLEHQKQLISNIRQALNLPDFIKDEQINYQLSWCKWMVHEGHSSVYRTIEGVKDHLRQQFLSDEGVANVIRAAEQGRRGRG